MNSKRSLSCFFLAALMATVVEASQRTFVSAGSGSDANPCTRQAPCRNFAAAMTQTDSGGEVVVLDSGGYGAVSIAQSVSLISPAGVYAGITAFSANAVTVNVDAAVVVLRGLSLNALGGVNGVLFTGQTLSASNTRLYVEHCVISGFSSYGLNFARNGTLLVSDTTFRESGGGIFADGIPGFQSQASIHRTLLERNNYGLIVDHAKVAIRDSIATANSGGGFYAQASAAGMTAEVTADYCQATHNNFGFGAAEFAGSARLMVSNSVVSFNNDGIIVGSNGTVRASNNTVTRNNAGLAQQNTGIFESRGNNTVRDNTSDTSGTITTFGPM